MPKPFPKEFRDDVVAVARRREPGVTLKQIATDFGISESCLTNWLAKADRDDGKIIRRRTDSSSVPGPAPARSSRPDQRSCLWPLPGNSCRTTNLGWAGKIGRAHPEESSRAARWSCQPTRGPGRGGPVE
jgi:transposase-like protein